jgi:hypothetical protein
MLSGVVMLPQQPEAALMACNHAGCQSAVLHHLLPQQ